MRARTMAWALALCVVLLVACSVFVTAAFLTDRDSVQNTFTFGRVNISLDEAQVDRNGELIAGEDRTDPTDRIQSNEYHLIPGHFYVKDPTVHIDATSEDCWLFVKLENDLKPIIADVTIEDQMIANGWTCIDDTNNIWAYKEIVSANEHINVFDSFELKDDADVAAYGTAKDDQGAVTGGSTIDVRAYAVQADGFDTAEASNLDNAKAAWAAAFAGNI